MKGTFRSILSPVKELNRQISKNEVSLEFSLPSGAYATVFLNEIMKNNELKLKDLYPKFASI